MHKVNVFFNISEPHRLAYNMTNSKQKSEMCLSHTQVKDLHCSAK